MGNECRPCDVIDADYSGMWIYVVVHCCAGNIDYAGMRIDWDSVCRDLRVVNYDVVVFHHSVVVCLQLSLFRRRSVAADRHKSNDWPAVEFHLLHDTDGDQC